MRKVFFVPFAYDNAMKTGVNISQKDPKNIYLKNLCVALISAKRTTPDIDVALVCNMSICDPYKEALEKNDIRIIIEPFDDFIFSSDYKWGLAFYKLCALKKMVERHEYDYYVFADADVIVQESLAHIYDELDDHILLYDINLGLQTEEYRIFFEEIKSFWGNRQITHYGGEFFGASHNNAVLFVEHCQSVYRKMIQENFKTTKGDEFITSIVAAEIKDKIKNAGAYIFRYWTGDFYLVSTCYRYNKVAILHMPSEKRTIARIFDKYILKGKFPSQEKIYRMCHLVKPRVKQRIKRTLKKLHIL
jgi:hypothetical protein